MPKGLTKRLFMCAKIILAIVLLLWVCAKVQWQDYVLDDQGRAWTWLNRVEDGKQYVAESYFSALFHGRAERQTRVFAPSEFQPADPQAPETDLAARYVRKGFFTTLRDIDIPLFVLAVLLIPLSLFVIAFRLWYLLRAQNIHITLWESVRMSFLGQFFNYVVPGTVGGDLVKAWHIARHAHHTAGVLVAIFLDRLVGMIELVLLSAVMLCLILGLGFESWETLRNAAIAVGVIAVVAAVALCVAFSPMLRKLLHLQKLYSRLPVAHHFEAAGHSAEVYRRRPGIILVAIGVSFINHVVFIGAIMLIGMSIGLTEPWYNYFCYIPLIYIIGAVPLTPGGVGLVESLYTGFFISSGAAGALALAMLARLVPMFWGLPGIWVAVRGPKQPKAEELEAALEAAEEQEAEKEE